jgi:hypothetical protein
MMLMGDTTTEIAATCSHAKHVASSSGMDGMESTLENSDSSLTDCNHQ